MPLPLSPIHHLGVAKTALVNALASLEHTIDRRDDDRALSATIDQQAPFIIEGLEHALAQVKRAQSASQAAQAIARCEASESRAA